jgi:hypothetical protein
MLKKVIEDSYVWIQPAIWRGEWMLGTLLKLDQNNKIKSLRLNKLTMELFNLLAIRTS